MSNADSSNLSSGWSGAEDVTEEEVISKINEAEIQADLKDLEEMRVTSAPVKRIGLQHTPAKNAAAKRIHKIKLQKNARKAQRGK